MADPNTGPEVPGKVKAADIPAEMKPGKAEAASPRDLASMPRDHVNAAPADLGASVAETLRHLEQRTRAASAAGPTPDLDETVPGGKYRVKGKLVNAHGREIHEDGTLVHPEQQQIDAFGRLV